ncbi:hypothetical protein MASR1M74_27280 [Lentimicrobium sp.]
MTIIFNNQTLDLPLEEMSMGDFLRSKQYEIRLLIVMLNGKYIKRAAYETTSLKEGDDVMVLRLLTGG